MATKTTVNQMVRASEKACQNQLQHLLVIRTPDGRLQFNGSTNFVNAVEADMEMSPRLQALLKNNVMPEGEVVTSAQILSYPFLPCSPSSPGWKGSKMIRKVLADMMACIGYADGGKIKKLGVGPTPLG